MDDLFLEISQNGESAGISFSLIVDYAYTMVR